jgi:hypothetical protein
MSINKYQPHILVLPEDDANRQIAIGFILNESLNQRAIQILPSAGGWKRVVEKFKDDYIFTMLQYPDRMIVLMIDFDDNQEARLCFVKNEIPDDLRNRVFVVGVKSEPENLKGTSKNRKSYYRGYGPTCIRSSTWVESEEGIA